MLVTRIHPKVFSIAAPFEGDSLVHLYLIDGPRRALIDTGTASVPRASLLPALAEIGWQPTDVRIIINTHMHSDHAGGNADTQEVTGGGIHMHRADYALANPDVHADYYLKPELRLLGREAELPQREAVLRQMLGREWGIERELEDGDVIDLGGDVRLDVVHTPGHTPGSSSFYWESEGLLFSGDAVNGRGTRPGGYPLYFGPRAYASSLRRLRDMPIRTLAQAHRYRWSAPTNEPVRTGAEVNQTLDDALAAWQAIDTAVRAELARDPRVDFPTLYSNVVTAVNPALGNEPPTPGRFDDAAVNTIAAHWREARSPQP